jgi:hypothetical protein
VVALTSGVGKAQHENGKKATARVGRFFLKTEPKKYRYLIAAHPFFRAMISLI